MKVLLAAAVALAAMSGAALAQSDPAKANTADPNSAPMAKPMKAKKVAKDTGKMPVTPRDRF